MAAPQEVEIKFLVPDLKALGRKLRELGFCEQTPSTHEVNTLYDLPGQKLRYKGELLRLRNYGGKWRLTHKAKLKLGRHKSRGELETGDLWRPSFTFALCVSHKSRGELETGVSDGQQM